MFSMTESVSSSIAAMACAGSLRADPRVIVGIPNTGRLFEEGQKMIGDLAQLDPCDRSLIHDLGAFVLVCARSNDLPFMLMHRMVDVILTGYDYVVEADVVAEELWDFGFQQCRVGLLGPPCAKDWRERPGTLRVATQYPHIASSFLTSVRPDAIVYPISGAAELYARLGMADVIIDAYMTGNTAAANHIVLLETILHTSGRLFARHGWATEGKDISAVVSILTGTREIGAYRGT